MRSRACLPRARRSSTDGCGTLFLWAIGSALVAIGLTVFADLTLAVEVGMMLAALLFIRRVARTTTVAQVTTDSIESGRAHILQDKAIPPYVTIFRIHGPFLFGATDQISRVIDRIPELPPIVIVRLRNMTAIDATGLHALEDLGDRLRESGRVLLLCGAREQPAAIMRAAGLHERIGAKNICPDIQAALDRAVEIHTAAAA